jgi:1-phosphatidylinositol phosphodiesterase
MAAQPDDASLMALTLPGTHDTMALYEPAAGTAKAQTLDLADQYAAGIRYVDIRCVDVDDVFQIYHGTEYEKASFDDVLTTTFAFLDANPTETIVMSVKQEADNDGATQSFEATFDGYVAQDAARWYTGDSLPTLGDVRGDIVLLRRFDATATPLGIDGSMWADNTTFTLTNTDSTLRVEDAYIVSDPATKWAAITSLFGEARSGDPATFYLTYTSGYEMAGVLPDIPDVSNAINPMLDAYFADPANAGAHLGVVAMDMVTADRVHALAAFDTP